MEKQNKPVIKKELVILGVGAVFVVLVSIVYFLTRPTLVNRSLSDNAVTSTSTTVSQGLQRTYCDIPTEGFPKTGGKYKFKIDKATNVAKYLDLLNIYNTSNDTSNPLAIFLGSRSTEVGLMVNSGEPATDVLALVWGNCKYDLDLVALGISSSRLGEIYVNNKQQLFFLQYNENFLGESVTKNGITTTPGLEVYAYKIDLKTKKIISKNVVPFSSEISKFPGEGDVPMYIIEESNYFEPATSKIFMSVGYFDGCYGYPSCVNISGYTEKMFETADKNIGAYEYNFETNKLERKVPAKHFNKADGSIFIKDVFEIGGESAGYGELFVKEQRETLKKL
jgi:hypothetical protein